MNLTCTSILNVHEFSIISQVHIEVQSRVHQKHRLNSILIDGLTYKIYVRHKKTRHVSKTISRAHRSIVEQLIEWRPVVIRLCVHAHKCVALYYICISIESCNVSYSQRHRAVLIFD